MVTLEQAKALKVGDVVCVNNVYDSHGRCLRWRVVADVKTWANHPEMVCVPVQHAPNIYAHISESMLIFFHVETEECSQRDHKVI